MLAAAPARMPAVGMTWAVTLAVPPADVESLRGEAQLRRFTRGDHGRGYMFDGIDAALAAWDSVAQVDAMPPMH